MNLNFKKTQKAKDLEELAKAGMIPVQGLDFTPVRKSAKAAGYDLSACIESKLTIPPDTYALVGTGVHIDLASTVDKEKTEELDEHLTIFGGIFPRSSKKGLLVTNGVGVCDEDYQGQYMVSFYNYSSDYIHINVGERIAQLLFIPTFWFDLVEVEEFKTITERGESGFGSTGV
jgi:dUTP pyrophosphatase